MRFGLGFWVLLVLLVSCGDTREKVTREQCSQVADHIASLIMAHYTAHPAELWDGMADPYSTGIPNTVTKDSFAAFLASPEGKTWSMQRHGQVRSSAEAGVESCEKEATPALVRCLLATKTRDDVGACDKAHPSRNPGDVTGADPPK